MEYHPAQEVSLERPPGGKDGVSIIKVRGRLTIHNFFPFQSLTRERTEAKLLLIDVSEVPYVDSAALGCLVGVHVAAERAGRKYSLIGPNERLRSLFTMTGVEQFLVTHKTITDAEADLA